MSTLLKALSLCAMLAATPAFAGTLNGNAQAFGGFSGTAAFTGGGGNLNGTVDYAVFTTGTFNSLFAGSGFTPAATDNYVYMYQVFNTGVDFISAHINAPVLAAQQGLIGTFEEFPADILPGTSQFTPFSAQWFFNGSEGPVNSSDNSAFLVYSSPFQPVYGQGVVINGGSTAATSEPVPGTLIPEPASALLLIAGLGLGMIRRS